MKFYKVFYLGLFFCLTPLFSFSQTSFKGLKSLVYLPEVDGVEVCLRGEHTKVISISDLESALLKEDYRKIEKRVIALEAFGADTINNAEVDMLLVELGALNQKVINVQTAYRNLVSVFSGYQRSTSSKVFWKSMRLFLEGDIEAAQEEIKEKLIKNEKLSMGKPLKDKVIRNHIDMMYLSVSMSVIQGDTLALQKLANMVVSYPSLISYLYAANFYNLCNDKEKAISMLVKALNSSNYAFDEIQDRKDRMNVYGFLGLTYYYSSQFDLAADAFKQFLGTYDKGSFGEWHGLDVNIVRLYLSFSYGDLEKHDLAIKEFNAALAALDPLKISSIEVLKELFIQYKYILTVYMENGETKMFYHTLSVLNDFLDRLDQNVTISEKETDQFRYFAYQFICSFGVTELSKIPLEDKFCNMYYTKMMSALDVLKTYPDVDDELMHDQVMLCKAFEGVFKFRNLVPGHKEESLYCLEQFYPYGRKHLVKGDYLLAYLVREASLILVDYNSKMVENEKAITYSEGLLEASEQLYSVYPEQACVNYCISCFNVSKALLSSDDIGDIDKGIEVSEFGLELMQSWFDKTSNFELLPQGEMLCRVLIKLYNKADLKGLMYDRAKLLHSLSKQMYEHQPDLMYKYHMDNCLTVGSVLSSSPFLDDKSACIQVLEDGTHLAVKWYNEKEDISLLYSGCRLYHIYKFLYQRDNKKLIASNRNYLALAEMIPASDFMEWQRLIMLAHAYESLGRALMDNKEYDEAEKYYMQGVEKLHLVEESYMDKLTRNDLEIYERLSRVFPAVLDHIEKVR